MNSTLFRSKHAPFAAAVVLGFFVFAQASGAPFGRVPGLHRTFLLATGWTALALMLVVMGYVLRKYAHRGRYSPEFRLRVDYAALERADNQIQRLRQRINAGALGSRRLIESEAASILRKEGVQRINRARVEAGPPGGEPWTVTIVPTEPLGRMARWMHVHLFYGTAFGALLLMHSGFRPHSGFGMVLAGFGYLVFVTGLVGIVLWAKGPGWLTRREHDLSIEEANALSASLRRKREAAIEALDLEVRAPLAALVGSRTLGANEVGAALRELSIGWPARSAEFQDMAALVAQERAVAIELRALRRIRTSFMAWRYVHIPAALVLTCLVAVHVFSTWSY